MKLFQYILIAAVQVYRCVLSPAKTFVLGPLARCRFEPSCSVYALQALRMHGAIKGSWLAGRRLCRCHPWGAFGPDPVPPVSNPSRPRPRPRPRSVIGSFSETGRFAGHAHSDAPPGSTISPHPF